MAERFELLEQLGRGGMGVVWKARHSETGDALALKLLHGIYADDPDYVDRFEREVEIARRIDSPHIVKVFGFGRLDGIPFAAMEYVQGPSLREHLKSEGPMDWDAAKRVGAQLARALADAHAAGVIHRDIKPSNVLLDAEGNVKLADFGIARAADMTRMTGPLTVLGTPAYMPPEGSVDERSDLYSFGCVLYELLSGAPPFGGDSHQQVVLRHIREKPDLTKLPVEARKVAGSLLAKDPRRRPASANELARVLRSGAPPPRRLARRTAFLGAFGGGIVAATGLLGAAFLIRSDDPEPPTVGDADKTATHGSQATTQSPTQRTSTSVPPTFTAVPVTTTLISPTPQSPPLATASPTTSSPTSSTPAPAPTPTQVPPASTSPPTPVATATTSPTSSPAASPPATVPVPPPPTTYYGKVTLSGAVPLPNMDVVAFVGGVRCGEGVTASDPSLDGDPSSIAYVVDVVPHSLREGCGASGRTVRIVLASTWSATVPWEGPGPKRYDLAFRN